MPLAWSRRLNAGFGGCGRGRILSHAVDADIPQTCKRPVVTRERAFFFIFIPLLCSPSSFASGSGIVQRGRR